MKEYQLSKSLALVAAIVAAYIAFLLIRDAGLVYSNSLNWSGGNTLQSSLFTAFIVSALASAITIALLIYRGSRSWFLVLLVAHVVFVVLSWPAYVILFAVLLWWFSKYVYRNT